MCVYIYIYTPQWLPLAGASQRCSPRRGPGPGLGAAGSASGGAGRAADALHVAWSRPRNSLVSYSHIGRDQPLINVLNK